MIRLPAKRLEHRPATARLGALAVLALLLVTLALPSAAAEPRIAAWGQALRVGQGEYRYFGFKVYQARLEARQRFAPQAWDRQALRLTLTYQRTLKGSAIAERSIEEMRRSGPIDAARESAWLGLMRECFPDVQEGDRLQGIYQPGSGIRFDHNGQFRCEIGDADFARQFMGIWLHANTSAPELRAALLGLGDAQGS